MWRYLFPGAVGLGLVVAFAGDRSPAPHDAAESPPASKPRGARAAQAADADGSALVLKRDSSGQFHMTAQVNGEDVRFMVDTGADVVALTVAEAQRLGIDVEPEQFEAVGQTASGVGYGLPVRLERVEIDGHELADVEAVVLDGLDTNLLGQSVLRRLGRMELRGDTMVLHAAS